MNQLKGLIILRLSWWMKEWGDYFPFSSDEILRNPTCLLWNSSRSSCKSSLKVVAVESLAPPPHASLKWNVDASFSSTLSSSSIGGVLRDHHGKFVLNWCNQVSGGRWNLKFIINFIRGKTKKSPSITIFHKSRATNTVADSLTKQEFSKRDEFIAWL